MSNAPSYLTVVFKVYDQALFKHESDRMFNLMKNEISGVKVAYTVSSVSASDEIMRVALINECFDRAEENGDDMYDTQETLKEIYQLSTPEEFRAFRFWNDGEQNVVPECMPIFKKIYRPKFGKELLEKPLEMFIRMQAYSRGAHYKSDQFGATA